MSVGAGTIAAMAPGTPTDIEAAVRAGWSGSAPRYARPVGLPAATR